MSKSQWLPDDKQTGNFSNDKQDTFEPGKGYVGIRLQQGVPLLDRDWNELEDIRRYAEVMLRRHYVGNGTPDDGFKIYDIEIADSNYNFNIKKGRCLVDGFEVVNDSDITYSQHAEKHDDVPSLTVPDSPRTDIVYLDVWIEEIKSANEEDPLKNPQDVKMETCIRHKVEWRVRVDEGNNGHSPEEKHYHYDIAEFHWEGGAPAINDLRTTNLNVGTHYHSKLVAPDGTPDPALSVDNNGKVGIGKENPAVKLDVNGNIRVSSPVIGRGAIELSRLVENNSDHTHTWRFLHMDASLRENSLELWEYKTGISGIYRLVVKEGGNVGIGTMDPKNKLDVEGGAVIGSGYSGSKSAPGNGLLVEGNVGIGTDTPGAKLHLIGPETPELNYKEGGVLVIGKIEGKNLAMDNNEIMARINKDISPLHLQADGGALIVHEWLNGKEFVVDKYGNVGIGTTEPDAQLSLGKWNSGGAGPSGDGAVQLLLSGKYNEGVNEGSENGTYKLKIEGYNNEGPIVYPIYCRDENDKVDFWIKNRPNQNNGLPTMYFAGKVGIGTTSPGQELHVKGKDCVLKLEGDDKVYIAWLHNGNETDRKAWTGFGGTNPNNFTIKNEIDAAHIVIQPSGKGKVKVTNLSPLNSDYAEFFESKNGKEIKVGTSVVMDNGKIRAAGKNEIPMGIISENPGIASGLPLEWPKKYLKDEFGNQIMEEYKEEIMIPKKEKIKKERQKTKKKKIKEKVKRTEIVQKKGKYCQVEIEETIEKEVEEPVFKEVDLYDASGKKKIGKHQVPVMETYEEIDVKDENGMPVMVGTGKFETKTRPKINPEYDETKEYIPREKRPEWNCVGLLGQLPLRKGQPVAPTWVKIKDISKDVELWLVK